MENAGCPFCGKELDIIDEEYYTRTEKYVCKHCGRTLIGDSYEEKTEIEINWKSSEEEIANMTSKQAIELLQKQIALGKSKGDWKPRKHMVKAFELAVEALKGK